MIYRGYRLRQAQGRVLVWFLLLAFLTIGVGSALVLTRLKLKAAHAKPMPPSVSEVADYGLRGPVKEVTTVVADKDRMPGVSDPLEVVKFDSSGRLVYGRSGDGHKDTCYHEIIRSYDAHCTMISEVINNSPTSHAAILYWEYRLPLPGYKSPFAQCKFAELRCDKQGRPVYVRYQVLPGVGAGYLTEIQSAYTSQGDLKWMKSSSRSPSRAGQGYIETKAVAYTYDSHGNWVSRKVTVTHIATDNSAAKRPQPARSSSMTFERAISYYPGRSVSIAALKVDRLERGLKGPVRSISGLDYHAASFGDSIPIYHYSPYVPVRIQFTRGGRITSYEQWESESMAESELLSKSINTYSDKGYLSSITEKGGPALGHSSASVPIDRVMTFGYALLPAKLDNITPGGLWSDNHTIKRDFDTSGRLVSERLFGREGKIIATGEAIYTGSTRGVTAKDATGKVIAHCRAQEIRDKHGNLTSLQVNWLTEAGKPSTRQEHYDWKIEYWE